MPEIPQQIRLPGMVFPDICYFRSGFTATVIRIPAQIRIPPVRNCGVSASPNRTMPKSADTSGCSGYHMEQVLAFRILMLLFQKVWAMAVPAIPRYRQEAMAAGVMLQGFMASSIPAAGTPIFILFNYVNFISYDVKNPYYYYTICK